jgi:hypothetical protein
MLYMARIMSELPSNGAVMMQTNYACINMAINFKLLGLPITK